MGARRKPSEPVTDRRAGLPHAYDAYDNEISRAWKEDNVEFGNALNLAVTIKLTAPLAEYVEQHQLTENERRALGGWFRSMSRRRRGQPRHQPERDAACLIATWRDDWRDRHGRKRVPAHETAKIKAKAIGLVAKTYGIDKDKISELSIDDLLSTGRVKAISKHP